MKTSSIIIGAVILIVVGWLLISKIGQNKNAYPGTTTQTSSPAAESNKAPAFHLQDYSGKTVNLADFAGKPIVINSWASWCPFCRAELPALAEAQGQLKDKVVIIAIDRAESLAVAKGYTDQQGTTGKLIFLLDPQDSFYKSIGGFSMPETIFVDKNGNIQYHKRGPMEKDEILQRAQALISQP